jgi:hypothetical protein
MKESKNCKMTVEKKTKYQQDGFRKEMSAFDLDIDTAAKEISPCRCAWRPDWLKSAPESHLTLASLWP